MTRDPSFEVMVTYQVSTDVRVEMGDRLGDRIMREFKKGPVIPKSEQDEDALNHLVGLGIAKAKEA